MADLLPQNRKKFADFKKQKEKSQRNVSGSPETGR